MSTENKYPELLEKGFTDEELEALTKWIDAGKPGLAKSRADRMGEIYLLGYSCQDLHKWFPEYPLETLLFARAQYDWDRLREEYKKNIQAQTLNVAMQSRLESIRFLSEVVAATHVKWRQQIMTYLANPEREKPPDCLPKGIQSYGTAVNLLKDLVTPPVEKKGAQSPENASPLVSVTVKSGDKPEVVIENSTQEEIRRQLMNEAGIDGD